MHHASKLVDGVFRSSVTRDSVGGSSRDRAIKTGIRQNVGANIRKTQKTNKGSDCDKCKTALKSSRPPERTMCNVCT
jgi:hypothetical protein